MRLLSIDLDGVLHPLLPDLPASAHFCWLPVLERMLEPYPDIGLAVHSTWRYIHSEDEPREVLGPRLAARYRGSAPRGGREDAVKWFMHLTRCETYLVIDDAPREFRELPAHRLLVCDPLSGISPPDVQRRLQTWLDGGAADPDAGPFGSTMPQPPTEVLRRGGDA